MGVGVGVEVEVGGWEVVRFWYSLDRVRSIWEYIGRGFERK